MDTRALNVEVKVGDRWRCEVEERDEETSRRMRAREKRWLRRQLKIGSRAKESQDLNEKVWFGK